MTKKILAIAMVSTLFMVSCKEKAKQETTETISTEAVIKATDKKVSETITEKLTDKSGTVLETSYDTDTTMTLLLKDEKIELIRIPSGSGVHFKNEHYDYIQWHGKTTIEKHGKVIFEAGEEKMPK